MSILPAIRPLLILKVSSLTNLPCYQISNGEWVNTKIICMLTKKQLNIWHLSKTAGRTKNWWFNSGKRLRLEIQFERYWKIPYWYEKNPIIILKIHYSAHNEFGKIHQNEVKIQWSTFLFAQFTFIFTFQAKKTSGSILCNQLISIIFVPPVCPPSLIY